MLLDCLRLVSITLDPLLSVSFTVRFTPALKASSTNNNDELISTAPLIGSSQLVVDYSSFNYVRTSTSKIVMSVIVQILFEDKRNEFVADLVKK